MKTMIKRIVGMASMAALCIAAVAQDFNSAYFINDYKFRHQLNPAFGAEHNYFSIGTGHIGVKMQGNFGLEDVLFDNPQYPTLSGKNKTTFLHPDISTGAALSGFNSGNNRILADLNINLLSAGFKAFGGFNTVELNSRTSIGMSLPYELFEFAKNTGNRNYNIGDVSFGAQSFAELALGHSRNIGDKLRVGAKLKFLFGLADAAVEMKDTKIELADNDAWRVSTQAQANVSVKGFMFKSKESEYKTREGSYTHIDDVDVDGTGLNGFGMAVDLGAEYKIDDNWSVSAALLDLGFIGWNNNIQATNHKSTFLFDGFHDLHVNSDNAPAGSTFDEQADSYADQLADFANLVDDGDQGSRTTGIGATINLGVQYRLPAYDKLSFGLLNSTRINGAYSWNDTRLSANVEPLKWIDGGLNLSFNSFTTSVGWILNIHPKVANFYIGMDHILGKTSKEFIPLSSNAAVTFGIVWAL